MADTSKQKHVEQVETAATPDSGAKKYRLRDGFTHYVTNDKGERVKLKAGDEVELTDEQFKGLSDRFEK